LLPLNRTPFLSVRSCKSRPHAPGDVLVDEINLKLTFSLSPRRRRAARRCEEARITRLFPQHRELMNALDKADQAAAKGLPEKLAGENRCG
jgi:hypothetical protein